MPDFNKLLDKAQLLDHVMKAESESVNLFDRSVLDGSAFIFETIIGQIVGFQWLRKLLSYLPATTHRINLPYLNYRFSIYDDPFQKLKNMLNFGTSYSHNTISYSFNIYETPFVFLHWITAPITKAAGWLAASPFAAIGYIGKEIYYGIKKAFARNKLHREIQKFEPTDLAAKCFINQNEHLVIAYWEEYAPYIASQQMLDGIFANIDTNLQIGGSFCLSKQNYFNYLCMPNNAYNTYSLLEILWKDYQEVRKKHLESQQNWAFANIILSGLFIIPLFFTIPSYKKLVSYVTEEKQKLDEITKGLSETKDPRIYYATIALQKSDTETGIYTLSKVGDNSELYEDAMSQLACVHLSSGNAEAAADCFQKSNEPHHMLIAQRLAANPNLMLSEIYPAPEEKTASSPTVVSSSNQSAALRSLSVFASPQDDSELQGLDDDEKNQRETLTAG